MSNRTYTSALNDGMGAANFPYIYDPNYVTTGSVGQPITGSWRPYGTSDISNNNISVSGLNLTVGAVAITGTPPVQISNFPTLRAISGQVTIINTNPINVTGIILTQVTGNISSTISAVAITGSPQVTINGGYVGLTGAMSGTFTFGTGDSISINNKVLAISGVTQANITNTAPIPISGVVNASVTIGNLAITGFNSTIAPLAVSGIFTASVGNVAITGTANTSDLISHALLSGLSGVLTTNLTEAAYVTGQVLAIMTGNFSSTITNPIGVTGTRKDINPLYSGTNTYNFLSVGGRVAAATGAGSITGGYNTGDFAMLNFAQNGGIYVNQGILDSTQDTITVVQSGLSTVSYTAPSGASPFTAMNGITGMALAASSNRLQMFVQNIHTGLPLYVLLGTSTPGTGNFSIILNPSINIGYGGGIFTSEFYKGQVNCSGGAWNAFQI